MGAYIQIIGLDMLQDGGRSNKYINEVKLFNYKLNRALVTLKISGLNHTTISYIFSQKLFCPRKQMNRNKLKQMSRVHVFLLVALNELLLYSLQTMPNIPIKPQEIIH